MLKALRTIGIAFIGACLGAGSYELSRKPVEPVIKIVYKEPTDVQLAAYWFGYSNKQELKNRICK